MTAIFTFHLREGHRWSDGSPFTSADFAYMWDDVINNEELYKGGAPTDLLADGSPPRFEVIDALTVRYSWDVPMPDFLPKLAAPAPILLALPSALHEAVPRELYRRGEACEADRRATGSTTGGDLHTKMSRQNRPENPDLPTLEPWRPRTAPPAEQFIFERNPYFHRVDERGNQLPYVDRVVLNVASSEIITAKTATGESDLQAAGISFSDYTLLKHSETALRAERGAVAAHARGRRWRCSRTSTATTRSGAGCSRTCGCGARCRSASTGPRSTR